MDKMYIPLVNGVGVYDKGRLCVAIVDRQGRKRVGGRMINPKSKLYDKPFFRGIGYFYNYLIFLSISLSLSRDLSGEKEGKRVNIFAYLLLSLLVGFSLFVILPRVLLEGVVKGELLPLMLGLFRVAIAYIILFLFKFIPLFETLYAFNRESCFRGKGEGLRNVSPLNFLNLLINTFLFTLFVISLIGLGNVFVNLVMFFALSIISIGIFYEILRGFSLSKSAFIKEISLVTNFLVLAKPSLTQKEVILVAELEIKNSNFIKEEEGRVSMSCVFAEMKNKLMKNDRFESSDAEWIVATILNKNRAETKLIRSVSEKEYRDIMRATDRRAKGEPISSIFGFVDFYGLRFDVNKKVLSPRMETELLVEEGIKKIKEHNFKTALDLCTGSGAIAVCLAKFTQASVSASDISKSALAVAEGNAKKNGVKVEFLQSNLFNELKKRKKYDIIISNPPYIKSGDILSLDEEVKKYDPRIALDGGEDGLDFYRLIISQAPTYLNRGGYLMFEVGINQSEEVARLMENAGFSGIEVMKDYNKIERIVYGRIC